MRESIKILKGLVLQKNISIFKSFKLYADSLVNVDLKLDKSYPIPVVALQSRMERTYRANLPWRAILSPDVTSEDIDLDVLMNANDLGNRSQSFRLEELKNFSIGINMDDIMEEFQLEVDEIGGDVNNMFSASLTHQMETNLKYYFALDNLKAKVPEEFWAEERVAEKPFRDFLSIYKF
jgi:hypothetical protein